MKKATIYISDGDSVRISAKRAQGLGLSNGDEITREKWNDIISYDMDEAITAFSGADQMSDAHKSISRLWKALGEKIGIGVDYRDLIKAIVQPRTSDVAVVLLAHHFLCLETNLLSNIDQVFVTRRNEEQVKNARMIFVRFVGEEIPRKTFQSFSKKIRECLKEKSSA